MKKLLTIIGLAAASLAGANAAVLFTENFGTLSNGTALSTSNTNFTYARTGTGTPVLQALNPGAFTGASGLMGASGSSLTGLGSTGFTAFAVGTLSFSLRTPSALTGTNNTLFFAVGAGTTFTGNGTFAGADLLAGYQLLNGQLQTRTGTGSGSWTNVGSALSTSTNYSFSLVFNGSASAVVYGSNTVAAGTTDIFLNGTLIGDDIDITDNLDATAFRFYTINSSAGSYEIDNVVLNNAAVPEPQTWVLIGIGSAFMLWNMRRKRRFDS